MKRRGLNSLTSWGTAVAIGLMNFLLTTPLRLSGLMYVEMVDYFNTSRTIASFPIFLSTILRCIIGPLIGYCGKRFGVKEVTMFGCVLSTVSVGACFFARDMSVIILFLGVLYGVGTASACTLIPQVLKNHFDKHLDKSIGFAYAFSPLAAIIIVPLAEYLFFKYRFAGTMLILSGIILHSVPISMLITSSAHSEQKSKSKKCNTFLLKYSNESNKNSCNTNIEMQSEKDVQQIPNAINKDILQNKDLKTGSLVQPEELTESTKTMSICENFRIFLNPIFLVIMLTQSFHGYVVIMVWTTSIDYSRDKGFDRNLEVYLLMCVPIADLIGRLGISWISDKEYVTKNLFCVSSFLVMGLSCAAIVWSNTFYAMIVSVMMFGLSSNGLSNTFPALIFEFMKKEEHIMALASRLVLFGPMVFTSSPMIGYFRSTLGSYNWIYYILLIGTVISSALTASLPYLSKHRQ